MTKPGAKAKSPAKLKTKKSASVNGDEPDLFSILSQPALSEGKEAKNTQLDEIYAELLKIRCELQTAVR